MIFICSGADEISVFGWREKQAQREVAALMQRLKAIDVQIIKLECLIQKASKIKTKNANRNGKKRELRVKELGAKKWIAVAREFALTRELSIENLQSQLNSKKESKCLLLEYIKSAELR